MAFLKMSLTRKTMLGLEGFSIFSRIFLSISMNVVLQAAPSGPGMQLCSLLAPAGAEVVFGLSQEE